MREILFRGKSLMTGKWITGGYFKHINRMPHPMGDCIKPKDIDHLIIQSRFADWGMPRGVEGYEVDPETVGQWTGLFDSEGMRIFEGDIIEFEHEGRKYWRTVEWFEDGEYSAFDFDGSDDFTEHNGLVWLTREGDVNCTVVGNIYDKMTHYKFIHGSEIQKGIMPGEVGKEEIRAEIYNQLDIKVDLDSITIISKDEYDEDKPCLCGGAAECLLEKSGKYIYFCSVCGAGPFGSCLSRQEALAQWNEWAD